MLRLPVRTVEPEPWALGARLKDEPDGVHRMRVGAGSFADGASVGSLGDQLGDVWVSIVVRDSALVSLRPDTVLMAGDDVVVLGGLEPAAPLAATFEAARPDR